jgi:hypothetical protein
VKPFLKKQEGMAIILGRQGYLIRKRITPFLFDYDSIFLMFADTRLENLATHSLNVAK